MDDQEYLIKKAVEFVKSQMKEDATGHDWWHIQRVLKMSLFLAGKEKADLFLVQLTALLHDIDDWKLNKENSDGDYPFKARQFLERLNMEEKIVSQTFENIKQISFKGAGVDTKPKTLEAMIVQDADRLDALGAIGIARCFATGAKIFGNSIYNPELKSQQHKSFEDYKNSRTTSINHFYEKLLLLKGLLNTKAAKEIAKERHRFMERFLEQFMKEWEGKI